MPLDEHSITRPRFKRWTFTIVTKILQVGPSLFGGNLWYITPSSIVTTFYSSVLLFFRSFILLFFYSSVLLFFYSFILLFFYSFVLLFFYSSIHLFIYSSIHLFIYSSIHLFIYSSIHLFIHWFVFYISLKIGDSMSILLPLSTFTSFCLSICLSNDLIPSLFYTNLSIISFILLY